jgi:hypothetical protein
LQLNNKPPTPNHIPVSRVVNNFTRIAAALINQISPDFHGVATGFVAKDM